MNTRIVLCIIFMALVGICGVQADIRTVPPGGTIFVGEEQLDISGSGIGPGTQIAWWAPGTSTLDTPADVVTVSDPSRFSALASSFSNREGLWYSLADRTPVLKIKEPRLSLRISDTTSDFDATGAWFPRGHLASFQIETNLYEIGNRGGVPGVPVDLFITTPGGSDYSAVSGPSGSFSLTGIQVTSAYYDTGPVWNTAEADSGTYSIRAECPANRINNNNPTPGAGVSAPVTVLIQGTNPLSGRSGSDVTITRDSPGPEETWKDPGLLPQAAIPSPTPAPSVTTPTPPTLPPSPAPTTSSPLPTATPLPPETPLPPVSETAEPTPSPQTPLPGLLAVLAVLGLILRLHR